MSSGDHAADLGATVAAVLKARFGRIDVAYKTVHNTPIETAILVPKTLSPEAGARAVPVLVHFHGGGLIVGENPEPWFLSDWVRDLAYTTPAIFVSPSYRLVPESRAVDSVDDIGDFWTWLHAHLPQVVQSRWPHLTPDLEHIAVAGESAGGFLAVQSALLFNRTAKIRAVIAQYPGLHTDLTTEPGRVRQPVDDPKLKAVVDAYVKAQEGKIRTSTPFLAGPAFFRALWNSGWPAIFEVYGEDEEGKLTLGQALARAEEVPPAMWVVQGADDWFVEAARAEDLVERVRRERPKAQVKYTVRPGGHGFDGASTLEEEWVREGVEFIKGFWLGGK